MKKVICKKLRDVASILPPQVEQMPQHTGIRTLRSVRDKNGQIYFGLITADVSRVLFVNHYRRIKKAYKRDGNKGVEQYVHKVMQQAKKAGWTDQPMPDAAADPRDQPGQMPAPGPTAEPTTEPNTPAKRTRKKKEVANG